MIRRITSPILRAPHRTVYGPHRGGPPEWTPAALFASGEQGAWYDPSDLSTMFQDSAGATPVTAVEQPVGRILDLSGRGNHATQVTAANKPTLSARFNMLRFSEALDDAAWTKSSATVTANTGASPGGPTTADEITYSGAGSVHQSTTGFPIAAQPYTFSVWLRADTPTTIDLDYNGASSGGNNTLGTTPCNVTTEWQRFTHTKTTVADNGLFAMIKGTSTTVEAWGAQVEPGSAATDYQRVSSATDYDSVGFPHYLKFDGTDDMLATGAIDLTATDKLTLFAGAHKLSDAAVAILCETSASFGANSGTFAVFAPGGAGVDNYTFPNRGTVTLNNSYTGLAAGNAYVLAGTGDISGDAVTFRANGVANTPSSGDMGTGNYGNHALHIGRRLAGTQPYNGRVYSLIVRGAASTPEEIADAEAYVAAKTGVILP